MSILITSWIKLEIEQTFYSSLLYSARVCKNFYNITNFFLYYRINQYIGHSVSIKTWEDFWFKESISIYLAYELNNQISHLPVEELKNKGEIIDVKFYII